MRGKIYFTETDFSIKRPFVFDHFLVLNQAALPSEPLVWQKCSMTVRQQEKYIVSVSHRRHVITGFPK